MKYRRGISPVIATTLLILIIVILGMVVFMFSKGFLEQSQKKQAKELAQSDECVNLINFISLVCYEITGEKDNLLHLEVSNRYKEISGGSLVQFNGNGKTILIPFPPLSDIHEGGGLSTEIPYPSDMKLESVQIIPVLELEEKDIKVMCENQELISVEEC